eukprot:GEMP01103826.1.p2 GENE.GEMP01103826.1~~GEMP01103826.1.p2  ORF type:complete len:109 (+),score=14.94 GEMP01103826.1:295-621(+)
MRLLPKDTTVRHIDLLDYGPKTLLGWHQDSFSIDRHTFTVVTTIVFRGRGGVDYAPIERKFRGGGRVVEAHMRAFHCRHAAVVGSGDERMASGIFRFPFPKKDVGMKV